jgi:hypothetical protein
MCFKIILVCKYIFLVDSLHLHPDQLFISCL